ncbi:metallophosphoesterase family protein [Verrucosispora sp. SN26_14.1]|uniref:metallophosphoesterase family protein n=1 Tax=Verrucosispora sp. SN26_14.1 TaxID=2527879 RepID=UPI0010340F65|nr:metallophosphoesterase family protein [Verrucosispora sp. SN26_14.1]TBL44234.1 metallophosphoesterase family protein [Verrucosispora sp. SN26_14.1]
MTVIWMINGNGGPTSMAVSVRVTTGPTIRIGRSTAPDFSSPVWSSALTVNSTGQVKGGWSGLTPGTRYWWRVEDNGVVDTSVTGTFVTDPAPVGDPASYTVACIGDAGITPVVPGVTGAAVSRLSNHPIFDTIRQRALAEGWLAVIHHGDLHYYDLGSGSHGLSSAASVAQYRGALDDVFAQPRQHELYRSAQFAWMHDDHDYGPNDSDSTSPGRANYLQVYRERIATPTLPLGAGNPVFYSWQTGRVLHILSDTRSARVPGSTMLGAAQLAWLQTLLATSTAEALVWHMPTPWLGLGADTWAGFTSERATIVGWLQARNWHRRMVMINADAHTLAISSAAGNAHGGFPVVLCAGLDASPHTWTAQYDQGMWPGREQYATVRVDDTGRDISLTATVWRRTRPIRWVAVNTGGTTHVAAGSPANALAL